VLIIGTCGEAGYAVIGAERVAGQPSRPYEARLPDLAWTDFSAGIIAE
jgi:hypothetical protein